MFWQAPITGLLFLLLPLLHPADLRPNTAITLNIYNVVVGLIILTSLGIILSYRNIEKNLPNQEQAAHE